MSNLKVLSNDELFNSLTDVELDENDYWDLIGELRSRPSDSVYEKVYGLALTTIPKSKSVGVNVLAQLGINPRFNQRKTVALFFDLLKVEQHNEVLENILSGIGHNNQNLNEEQVELLTSFSNHKNESVRYSLVHSLLSIESEKAIEALILLTKDKSEDIRSWATFGIGTQIDSTSLKIIEALWHRTEDINVEVRSEALAGLVKRKIPEAKHIILEILKSGEFGTLEMQLIQDIRDKDFLPLLEMNLEKFKEDEELAEDWLTTLKETIQYLSC